MSATNSFIRNSLLNFNRNILTMVLGFASTIIIARVLGPEKQGIYTLVVLLPNMLVTFLNVGIGPASVYYVGKQKYSIETIVSTNIFLALIISAISIVIGILSIVLFRDTFFKGVPIIYLFIILSVLPLLFANSFLQAVFQGLQDFKVFNLVAIFGSIMNLVFLIIVVLLLRLNVIGAIISFFASVIAPTLILIIYLKKRNIIVRFKYISKEFIKDSLIYGYKAHLSNILAFVNYRADILMISYFLSPAAVGIYNVAVSIAEKLWFISQPVSTVLFPRISSMKSDDERNKLTAVVARNVLFISLIVAVILYFIIDILIVFIFGEQYKLASKVIKILLVGITLFSAERILSNDLAGRGKPEINLYTSLFTVATNVALNIVLIPISGILGAALATSITYSLAFILKIVIFCKITKVGFLSIILINKNDIKLYKNMYANIKRRIKK